ncbi:MAG TPA: Lpg1974 family pore-forming outer membrane protein [Chlamydiales bacterium]|nr:Lpg1974 family pore-forming outer membrane protein [Chlamydiales bacterium]
MKWILASALLSTLSLYAAETDEQIPAPGNEIVSHDLFKKDTQIYSGSAEFLYWTVAEGALDYALKMRHNAWGPSISYAQGTFKNAEFDVEPGVRVSLLYFRAPHYWEVKWQYTRLTLDGHDSVSKPSADQNYLTGTWPQITSAPLARATSHIHMNYNIFDWLVDRVFIPNPHLRFRILGGGFAAWINQDWKVRYTDSTPNSTTIRNKWRFIGAGLKTGTMVDWFMTRNFYLTAQGMFGVLMGNYWNQAKQTTTVVPLPGDNPSIPIRNAKYKDARPVFTSQMLIGPSWQKNYPKNRIEAFAGVEINFWSNLQEVYRSTGDISSAAKETWINSGLFALYGLTTRVTVDF